MPPDIDQSGPIPLPEVGRGIKVVLSDIHMGQGMRAGFANPYEEFHEDERLVELLRHYAGGRYADLPVELILNGDILDLLRVPYRGRFVTEVTEDVAIDKVRRCVLGHPSVFDALADFAARPDRRITYVAGNHDLDVAFPGVQRLLRARLGLDASSPILQFCTEDEFYRLPGGVVVTHGHMLEAMSRTDAGTPLKTLPDGRTVVNMPWSSYFVLDVLAPAKREQPLIDMVHPLSSFILWGLLFDPRFTVKILWQIVRFYLKTPVRTMPRDDRGILKALQVLVEEMTLHDNLEGRAYRLLQSSDDMTALIVGHSHQAKTRRFVEGKTYVNTGTWEKVVSLDLRDLGPKSLLSYAVVEYPETGLPVVRLMRWRGESRVNEEMRL